MTNELEKQFFQCFGIEPKCQNTFINPSKCPFIESRECCDCVSFVYPQISDRIYLMLLATLTCISSIEFPFSDIQKLKEDILKEAIKHQYGFDKHQVRTLFEEG